MLAAMAQHKLTGSPAPRVKSWIGMHLDRDPEPGKWWLAHGAALVGAVTLAVAGAPVGA